MPQYRRCPACGASVREANLPSHLRRVHPGRRWDGEDARGEETSGSSGTASRLPVSPRKLLGVAAIVLLGILVAVAAFNLWPRATPAGGEPEEPAYAGEIHVYLEATCGCCHQYLDYLRARGFAVTPHEMEDVSGIKDGFGIPADLRSCHTAEMDGYFVEGHVPVAAIQALQREQPPIDGITLPGMPSGSPGMGGSQTDDFVIQALADGQATVFLVL